MQQQPLLKEKTWMHYNHLRIKRPSNIDSQRLGAASPEYDIYWNYKGHQYLIQLNAIELIQFIDDKAINEDVLSSLAHSILNFLDRYRELFTTSNKITYGVPYVRHQWKGISVFRKYKQLKRKQMMERKRKQIMERKLKQTIERRLKHSSHDELWKALLLKEDIDMDDYSRLCGLKAIFTLRELRYIATTDFGAKNVWKMNKEQLCAIIAKFMKQET